MNHKLIQRSLLLLLVIGNSPLTTAFAQGTAFTYQGRLATNGVAFSGSAEFQFTLWDALSSGNAVATNNPISVIAAVDSNGLFTVTLDFGISPFNGQPRFLQPDVRTSIGPFTSLTRQPVTAAPYALRALNLTTNGLAGTYGNAVTLNNAGNSFVGTLTGTFIGTASGNGAGLTNVNATTLGGLAATAFWKTNGNAGANPTNGVFLGTTDNLPLELKVNGLRAFRLEPNASGPNVIEGSDANIVAGGVASATIGGGLNNRIFPDVNSSTFGSVIAGGAENLIGGTPGSGSLAFGGHNTIGGGHFNNIRLNGDFNVIAGGEGNTISSNSSYCFISGGNDNTIAAEVSSSTIAGGIQNSIGSNSASTVIGGGTENTIAPNTGSATIAGGNQNAIGTNANTATIGGGFFNVINPGAFAATIPGGEFNLAGASYTYAAGRRAHVMHMGTFAWADATPADFTSTSTNQFLIRAGGGVGINTANPVADLHVNGPIVIQGPVLTPGATASSNLLNLMVGGGTSSIATNGSLNGISFYEASSVKAMSFGYDGSGSSSANALRIYGSTDTPLFTFQNNGSLGVGTTTPATALHVRDTLDAEISVESTDAGGHRWTLQSTRVAGSATDASFQILDRTSGGTRLFIGTNGFVGIGTTNPTNRLHVSGGVSATAFITTSDRHAKENFQPVSPRDVLAKVAALPISTWNFKELRDGRHMGPMAQDFYAAFALGGSDTTITTIDPDGVALAAIQGLNEKVEVRSEKSEVRIQKLEAENAELRQRLTALEQITLHPKSN